MFYFTKYEDRKPLPPIKHNEARQTAYRILAIINIIFSTWYITWRWTSSLNYEALTFSLILVIAETASCISMLLWTYNLWSDKDIESIAPPVWFSELIDQNQFKKIDIDLHYKRLINIDILITTYNEDVELVRLSIIDARKMEYPFDININIYVLDDGNRLEMKKIAEEEGVSYIAREHNIGFKAGNLANAIHHTYGDFIVICDADTRLFPGFLAKTLGFFCNPLVAWVQTPQWFYDIHPGVPPSRIGEKIFGRIGKNVGLFLEKTLKIDKVMEDPFYNNSQTFYDLILRRRNAKNASFCCGAASIHRREALYEVAVEYYISSLKSNKISEDIECNYNVKEIFSPFKFHISEDIYTSLLIHGAKKKKWQSILYPEVLSKMLSTQDFKSRCKQLYRYATGTLDMAFKELPFSKLNMTFGQKILYFSTIYSYIGAVWHLIFLVSPIIYLFTEIAPVGTSYQEFLKHLVPYLLINEITQMVDCAKLNKFNDRVLYLGFIWINLNGLVYFRSCLNKNSMVYMAVD